MKIINETNYRTDHLRAFVMRVAKDDLDPKQRQRQIRFRYGTAQWVFTEGINHNVAIWLPSNGPADKVELARMIAWGCTFSKSSRQFVLFDPRGLKRQWALALPLDKKPEKPAASGSGRAIKLEYDYKRALVTEATWQRKLKLAQTKVKVWEKKVQRLRTKTVAAKILG